MTPLFSVIIPLYNTAEYLHQTIGSVISQSLGFEDKIEIILVNDGSEDDTESICLKYKEAYPDNIFYISQENAGVSAARNAGIPYIRGKYTNFMDADDLWDENAFAIALDMFEKHGSEIDAVSCRMDFFEAKTGYHQLDYKFRNGDLICDISENPSYVQFSVCSCFIKSDSIGSLRFDTRLTYGEDAKFINQLILKKEKYGLLASAVYHVRKRDSSSSLTQNKQHNPASYLDTANYYYKYLADLSTEKFRRIIPYIQYALINGIKYRVSSVIPESIPADIRDPYIDIVLELIKQIDDEVICRTNGISTEVRICLLLQKYSLNELKSIVSVRDGVLYAGENKVGKLFRKKNISVNGVQKHLLKTIITGTVTTPVIFDDLSLRVFAGSSAYDCEVVPDPSNRRLSYRNDDIRRAYTFRAVIPSLKYRNIRDLRWTAVTDGYETAVAPDINPS